MERHVETEMFLVPELKAARKINMLILSLVFIEFSWHLFIVSIWVYTILLLFDHCLSSWQHFLQSLSRMFDIVKEISLSLLLFLHCLNMVASLKQRVFDLLCTYSLSETMSNGTSLTKFF